MKKRRINVREGVSAKRTGFANPFIDAQFKQIFDEETTKEFLNSLLDLESPIAEVSIVNSESNDTSVVGKRIYFDVICRDERGRVFITEMQNVWEGWLKDRIVYYTCRKVDEQGRQYDRMEGEERESWEYNEMRPVYAVCLLNDREKGLDEQCLIQDAVLYDTVNSRPFSGALRIVIVNLRVLSQKNGEGGDEYYRKMLLLMQEMESNMKTAESLYAEIETLPLTRKRKDILRRAIWLSDISQMSEAEYLAYEEREKVRRDNYNIIRSEHRQGVAEGMKKGMKKGRAEGRAEGMEVRDMQMAEAMRAQGFSQEQIDALLNAVQKS